MVKKLVFNNLSKTQKSELCNYVKKFVEKNKDYSTEEIFDAFFEEEQYYLDLNTSRHAWIAVFLENEEFINDLKKYINECKNSIELKIKQKPFLDAQKQKQKDFLKVQRKVIQDKKMSEEKPTKKQKYYYGILCKKYGIDPIILANEEATKLDYKNAIEKILEENFK